jgi:uncharacterized membrane protein YeaQ/YmgE (transglycosylase-associated protein family)
MHFILWTLLGATLGWLASRGLGSGDRLGLPRSMVVGASGALLAGLFMAPLVGNAPLTQLRLSLPSMLVAFAGAVVLLMVADLLRSRRLR